jgi:hypothetical protein
MALTTVNGERVRNNYREQGAKAERERIIDLLKDEIAKHTKVLESRPNRADDNQRHTICRTYQAAITLIKGENK